MTWDHYHWYRSTNAVVDDGSVSSTDAGRSSSSFSAHDVGSNALGRFRDGDEMDEAYHHLLVRRSLSGTMRGEDRSIPARCSVACHPWDVTSAAAARRTRRRDGSRHRIAADVADVSEESDNTSSSSSSSSTCPRRAMITSSSSSSWATC